MWKSYSSKYHIPTVIFIFELFLYNLQINQLQVHIAFLGN